MKAATKTKRQKATALSTPLPLKVTAIVLTQAEVTRLTELAQEQSDLIGRTITQ
jgi:hypothetical protein